ncbi:hypothetical protein [Edaphobacillus lindanitolerans]|uniref:Antigen I/II N-terminal domain-containing protein n=1 Tax=Edaphobacillus lindanitolerans TaxID=550447 RepID=A0A1U7PNT1_9BACI|nr:hypothetical protein [Edaphobacillus lindanitolerans]SIT75912.1 hypothetical protein SAMN05428946_1204 [Edaphobacillus lindanitolerans]
MKKWMMLVLVALLAGCGATGKTENENAANKEETAAAEKGEAAGGEKQSAEGGAVEVDKGLFNVEVTVPPSFFEGEDVGEAVEQVKAEGKADAVKNADGSVTFKMSKAQHKEMMAELLEGVEQLTDEMKGDGYPSIRDITHDKRYTKFEVTVDREQFENSFDGFALLGVGFAGMYVQLFDGVNADDLRTTVILKDEATGEQFDEMLFPDVLDEMESETEGE